MPVLAWMMMAAPAALAGQGLMAPMAPARIDPAPVAQLVLPGESVPAAVSVRPVAMPVVEAGFAPASAPAVDPQGAIAQGAQAPAVPSAAESRDVAPYDPWEKTNRAIFSFDTAVDRALLRPVAHGYRAITPSFVRARFSGILSNLDEPITAGNEILQLHPGKAAHSLIRILVNTTFGLGGMFDVAAKTGVERHPADFGQTLGRWGVKPGAYVVLPLFGPANVRDSFGRAVDYLCDPMSYVFGGITSNFGIARAGAEVIDIRVASDPAFKTIYEATDPYATARSGYMQGRDAMVREATGKAEVLPDFDAP